jgi:hypothetical protein
MIGGYTSVESPESLVLVFMLRNPCKPGLDERSPHRAGRIEMLATSFVTFERNIRDQLQRILQAGGFDAARDITAITVYRWPHGYAYEYNYLFDPAWAPGQAPHEIGRARFGRIAIANSDSGVRRSRIRRSIRRTGRCRSCFRCEAAQRSRRPVSGLRTTAADDRGHGEPISSPPSVPSSESPHDAESITIGPS